MARIEHYAVSGVYSRCSGSPIMGIVGSICVSGAGGATRKHDIELHVDEENSYSVLYSTSPRCVDFGF